MALEMCSVNTPNGGAPNCDKSRGIPRYAIIGDYEWQAADFASIAVFKARLKTQTLKGRGESGKLIVLPLFADVQKRTSENQTGSLNQGFTEVLREGFPAFDGGMQISNNHAQKLRPLNGADQKVTIVDHNLNAWFTYLSSSGNARGEDAKLFIGGDDFTDGQNSKTVLCNIAYTDVEAFKQQSRYFTIDFSVADYGRLKDVDVTLVSGGGASNVHNVTVKIKTGKIGYLLDIYSDYAAQLANTSRWTCKDAAGAAFTITSVAQNAGGYWVITLDSTAYSALTAGDHLYLNLAAPSVLDAAGATGIEGVVLQLTKA